jgi:KUP system potassium uptake protein
MIDDPPNRIPGTAVFLTSSLETVPPALLNNAEHNGIVHEHVVLVKLQTVGVPHVDASDRVSIQTLRLGFATVTARYGYQDEPDVVRALGIAQRQGLAIDLDRTSYFVDHVSILPTGEARMARWRKRLFVLLHQNSIPPARYFHIPPDRVFEVGAYVEF